MNHKYKITLLFIVSLALAGVGCGRNTAENTPTTSRQTIDLSTVTTKLDFDSYEFSIDFRFTTQNEAGNPFDQTMRANAIVTSDPPATSMVMNVAGIPELATFGDGSDIEMVQMDGTTYMAVPNLGCLQTADDNTIEQSLADLTNPANFLSVVESAEFVQPETINGLDTNHYRFDLTNLKANSVENFESLQGDLYLAVDGDYLVRLEMSGAGVITDFITQVPRSGELYLEMNLSNVNADLMVTLPESCTAADNPAATHYPMLSDASEIVSMPGMMSYQTQTAVSEVASFYIDTLTADGWTQDLENVIFNETTTVLVFNRDEANLAVTIALDPTTNITSVIIVSE